MTMTGVNCARVKCTCKHEFQDQRYGKYRRVANIKHNSFGSSKEATCTVCGRIHKV